jgi:hypothetical protein
MDRVDIPTIRRMAVFNHQSGSHTLGDALDELLAFREGYDPAEQDMPEGEDHPFVAEIDGYRNVAIRDGDWIQDEPQNGLALFRIKASMVRRWYPVGGGDHQVGR